MRKFGSILAVLALLALTGCTAANASTTGAPLQYVTPDGGELVSSLPALPTDPVALEIVYCVDLGTVPAAGAVLLAHADAEFTNPYDYNLELSTAILFTSSCASTSGVEITHDDGFNISRDMHHGEAAKTGSITVGAGNTYRYVVFRAWAASSPTYYHTGDAMVVEHGYGNLGVLLWP